MSEPRARLCQRAAVVLGWAAIAVMTLLTAPRVAQACSGRSIGVSWYIAETWPGDGDATMPVDGVIAVRMAPWGPGVDRQGAWPNPDDARLLLSMTTADGITVNGQNRPFGNVSLWRPTRPLKPNTRYIVRAEIQSGLMLPSDAPGGQQLELEFTTGAGGAVAPLAMSPELEFEAFEAEVNECADGTRVLAPPHDPAVLRHHQPTHDCADWSAMCKPADAQRAALARVDVGPISGGQVHGGYVLRAVVSRGEPFSFDAPEGEGPAVLSQVEAYVPPGGSQILNLLVPKQDRDYEACVQLRATDADGRSVDWRGPCKSRAVILGDDGEAHTSAMEASQGCSVAAPGQPRRSLAWLSLLTVMALFLARRARR